MLSDKQDVNQISWGNHSLLKTIHNVECLQNKEKITHLISTPASYNILVDGSYKETVGDNSENFKVPLKFHQVYATWLWVSLSIAT